MKPSELYGGLPYTEECRHCKTRNRVKLRDDHKMPICGECKKPLGLGTVFIPSDELRIVTEGADNEGDLVNVIKTFLRTEEQRKWMSENDVSIEDILNGRTYDRHQKFIHEKLFPDWNLKVGKKSFGFGK